MTEVLLDALEDSILIIPFLFVVYLLIEIIEKKYIFAVRLRKIFRSKYSPVIGASVGLIPQCGFSVMATNLYLSKNTTLGTLVAIYIATSDEAIPILLSNFSSAMDLLPILGIKIVFAITMGFLTDLVTKKYQNENYKNYMAEKQKNIDLLDDPKGQISDDFNIDSSGTAAVESGKEDIANEEIIGCFNHVIKPIENRQLSRKEFISTYFQYPIQHTLKIFTFILIINLLFNLLIYFIGEANLMSFLYRMSWYQPFLVGLVGLIPNCAASVIVTQMYVVGGITMGACITGLCVNSGVAVAVLFRKSNNKVGCVLLMAVIYLASVILGILLTFLNI
jgi:hypothetical protein